VNQVPREQIPGYICTSDVCLVLLKKTELFKTVIPTKMLEFMSCERPIILGVDGQARQILEQAQAGVAIEPENAKALANAIIGLKQDAALRERFGRNGRGFIVAHYSREQTAKEYIRVLEDVMAERFGL
jgi:glycosyltransferase involved in cell wall biosynthesis